MKRSRPWVCNLSGLNQRAVPKGTALICVRAALPCPAARRVFSEVETDGFAFDIEVIMTAISLGYTIGEMPVKIVNHRESKIHVFSDSIKMVRDLLHIKKMVKERSRRR